MLASFTLILALSAGQTPPPDANTTAPALTEPNTAPAPLAVPAEPTPTEPKPTEAAPTSTPPTPPPSAAPAVPNKTAADVPSTSAPAATAAPSPKPSRATAAEPQTPQSFKVFGVDLLKQEPLDSQVPVNTKGHPLALGLGVTFNALPGFGFDGHLAYRLGDNGPTAVDFVFDAGLNPFFDYGLALSGRAGLALSVFTASGYFANPFLEFGAHLRVTHTTQYGESINYTYLEPTIGLGAETLSWGFEPRILLTWPVSVGGFAPQGPSLSLQLRYRF